MADTILMKRSRTGQLSAGSPHLKELKTFVFSSRLIAYQVLGLEGQNKDIITLATVSVEI